MQNMTRSVPGKRTSSAAWRMLDTVAWEELADLVLHRSNVTVAPLGRYDQAFDASR